jgi:hypothetical protein
MWALGIQKDRKAGTGLISKIQFVSSGVLEESCFWYRRTDAVGTMWIHRIQDIGTKRFRLLAL